MQIAPKSGADKQPVSENRPDKPNIGHVAVFSRTLARIPNLPAFLRAENVNFRTGFGFAQQYAANAIPNVSAGWGHKPTADKARRFADKNSIPYWAVEDGFLRSLDLGVNGVAPLSLVVDDIGIYYDSIRPSRLEELLNGIDKFRPELLDRAQNAVDRLLEHRLSKYNSAPELPIGLLPPTNRRRILIVDQTLGDMSVQLGNGSEAAFRYMLECAQEENPQAELVVKLHPDTANGTKRGYLSEMDLPQGTRVIDIDVNPGSLLERCDHVYTVTSQLGMEALLAGLPVTCHGIPFYAGWGATRDRLNCLRRTQSRSALEIFAAAWLQYARYVDPTTGSECDIERIIDLLIEAKRINEINRGTTICLGMPRWKRRHLRPFLASTGGKTIFARTGGQAIRRGARPGDRILIWGDSNPAGLQPLVSQLGAPLGRVEDGFLRSVGLGSDFIEPCSLSIDWQGAHFNPSLSSDLETLLEFGKFAPEELERAARLHRQIVDAKLSKYNVGASPPDLPSAAKGRKIILVPGQVENDASVRLGGGTIQSNLALVREVRETEPDAFIAWKPHPDVVAGNRRGGRNHVEIEELCDTVWTGVHIHDCLNLADEVHVLTSLTGFEALLRKKKVVTYGGPFFAGWSLTTDRMEFPRRSRALSLDELIAGVLVRYPRYYDWQSGIVCDVEGIAGRISKEAALGPAPVDVPPLKRPGKIVSRVGRYVAGIMNG